MKKCYNFHVFFLVVVWTMQYFGFFFPVCCCPFYCHWNSCCWWCHFPVPIAGPYSMPQQCYQAPCKQLVYCCCFSFFVVIQHAVAVTVLVHVTTSLLMPLPLLCNPVPITVLGSLPTLVDCCQHYLHCCSGYWLSLLTLLCCGQCHP